MVILVLSALAMPVLGVCFPGRITPALRRIRMVMVVPSVLAMPVVGVQGSVMSVVVIVQSVGIMIVERTSIMSIAMNILCSTRKVASIFWLFFHCHCFCWLLFVASNHGCSEKKN